MTPATSTVRQGQRLGEAEQVGPTIAPRLCAEAVLDGKSVASSREPDDARQVSNDVHLRAATLADQSACEALVRDAFWNLYRPGCHEHYLWHLAMQGHPDVMSELTTVATRGDDVVGCVMSARAHIATHDDQRIGVLAPGPLAVSPNHQRHGVGGALLQDTLDRARLAGWGAAFLYGDPAYYSRFGFIDAAAFNVTTAEGDNFADFMGMELVEGSLAGVSGRLIESSLFDVDQGQVEAFDTRFPPRRRATGPGQA